MTQAPFNSLPQWIEIRILYSLDFLSLLHARTTCRRWNEIVNLCLADRAILNIRMDPSSQSKRFRRGKWNPSLIAPYQEIRIIPKQENAYYGKILRWKHSTVEHFTKVVKLTLFEFGSFLHFIHRYMASLPSVKYVQLRELRYDEMSSTETNYSGVAHAFSTASFHAKTWYTGMANILSIETLRIRLFDQLATIIYMNLFTFRTSSLVNLEIDCSKFYGLPLARPQVTEVFSALSSMIEFCYQTLRQLRLKWAVRVETDLDYNRSDEDVDPFMEFLLALRNPAWMKLRLHQLLLNFPTINFGMNLCDSTLIPFLQELEPTLKRACLGRVLPGVGIDAFSRRFPSPKIHKFEFVFYFNDTEISPQPVSVVRGVEILMTEMAHVDLFRVAGINRGRRENGLKYYMHLKLMNAHGNLIYEKPDILRLTDYFHSVRTLELLDNSGYTRLFVQFTSGDFNLIVKRMPRLVSLKMSNASRFTDAGLTKINEAKIRHMFNTGAFYMPNANPPAARAKELRYLDLRDLPSSVSDIAVYFAFQHIPKLEKIAFHGTHLITPWGKQILENRHRRNPYFEVIFKSFTDDYVTFGNYTLPCLDFP